jgi:hypothetical protein
MEKHSQVLVIAGKESGLEVNAEKTEHMVRSRERMQEKITI